MAPAETTAAKGHMYITSWPVHRCVETLQRGRPVGSCSVQAHMKNLACYTQHLPGTQSLLRACMPRIAAAESTNMVSSSSSSHMLMHVPPPTMSANQAALVRMRLTLTKLRAETGLCRLPPSAWPPVSSVVGMCSVLLASRVKTCTVPLSLETATYSGVGPREKAMLKMVAGSAPLLSSCTTMQA